MGSWIQDGFLVLGTALHGNIWHGTDHGHSMEIFDTARIMARKYVARHGSTRSWHGTGRPWHSNKGIPLGGDVVKIRKTSETPEFPFCVYLLAFPGRWGSGRFRNDPKPCGFHQF